MQLLRAASPAAAQRSLTRIAAPQRHHRTVRSPAPAPSGARPPCRGVAGRPALPPSGPADAGPAPAAPALAAQPWLGTPEQVAALTEMRARFAPGASADADGPAPAAPPPADELLRWYLRDRYFSVDAAEKKLRSMLEWRGRYASRGGGGAAGALWETLGLPGVCAGDVGAELATGKAYVHGGTDAAGRPVLVVVARKHATGACLRLCLARFGLGGCVLAPSVSLERSSIFHYPFSIFHFPFSIFHFPFSIPADRKKTDLVSVSRAPRLPSTLLDNKHHDVHKQNNITQASTPSRTASACACTCSTRSSAACRPRSTRRRPAPSRCSACST